MFLPVAGAVILMTPLPLTLDEVKAQQQAALEDLVRTAGNPSHLARMIGVPVTTVHGWCQRGRISKDGAKKVGLCPNLPFDAVTLRPDL